ncbi:MAG: hypothetical protein C0167_00320 [Nitrososphaera sp.]|nr:MAG: hypothetical protein C0167_00320 [Nitrososphaera sp.]
MSVSLQLQNLFSSLGTGGRPGMGAQIGDTVYGIANAWLLKKEPLIYLILNVGIPIAGNLTRSVPEWLTYGSESLLGLAIGALMFKG